MVFILLVVTIFLYISVGVVSNPHFSEKSKQHGMTERCNWMFTVYWRLCTWRDVLLSQNVANLTFSQTARNISIVFSVNSYNKTNYMHQFLKFTFGIKLCLFRTVPLSIIRSFLLYTQQWCMSYRSVWHTPLLCVQWKTPDDGQRNCPKQAEFYSKSKFEKLVHIVGFIVRIYTKNYTNISRSLGKC